MPDTLPQNLPIGEVARRTGVSVKALRHYEDEGLLAPGRNLSGRRVYGRDDIYRLQQVLVLKRAGLALGRIAEILRRESLSPAHILDAQISILEERRQALDLSLTALRHARTHMEEGGALSPHALCDLIKDGEKAMELEKLNMQTEAWSRVFSKYYSEEDMKIWDAAKGKINPGLSEEAGRQWIKLIAEVEALIASGAGPSSEAAITIAKEWLALQQPMVDAVGLEVWKKASTMYAEMDQWSTPAAKPPFSAEVFGFVSQAAEAGREAGLIPPRKT